MPGTGVFGGLDGHDGLDMVDACQGLSTLAVRVLVNVYEIK